MATQETLDRVQALYVAYYGRPADQEGQEYWADRIEAEGEGAIINAFGTSAEYTERFGDQSNADAINNLYNQMFGRDAEPNGLAYWSGVLNNGEKSLAEIATTILNAAGGQDRQVVNAKVAAAAEYTAEFGAAEDYNLEAATAVVAEADGGLYVPALTEALQTLQEAQTAKVDFLETAADNELVREELTDGDTNADAADAENVTPAEVEAAIVQAQSEINTALETARGTTSDRVVQANLEDAQQNVAVYQEELAKVAGLRRAIEDKMAAVTAEKEATTALNGANSDLNGEAVTFGGRNAADVNITSSADIIYLNDADPAAPVTVDGDTVANIASITDADGLELFTVANGQLTVSDAAAALELEGLDMLQADIQAKLNAEVALTEAEDVNVAADGALAAITDTSAADIDEATGTEVYTELLARQSTVETNQEALEARQELIADAEEINALAAELEAANTTVTEAQEAITDPEADGGLGVDLLSGADNFDAGDDVYLFNAEEGDLSLANFGADGEDLFFIGDAFTRVDLEDTDTLDGASFGQSGALEVFFQDNGTGGVTLSFETEAFQGNSTSVFEGNEITLTGVAMEDLQLENGYITIA